jgi:hypothetical protein
MPIVVMGPLWVEKLGQVSSSVLSQHSMYYRMGNWSQYEQRHELFSRP